MKSVVAKTAKSQTDAKAVMSQVKPELKLKRSPVPSASNLLTRNNNPLLQPKPRKEEEALKAKYASIPSLEEKAFHILQDLGMVELTPDPDDPSYDHSTDTDPL